MGANKVKKLYDIIQRYVKRDQLAPFFNELAQLSGGKRFKSAVTKLILEGIARNHLVQHWRG